MRYCKSTIFQANHNMLTALPTPSIVVCDTAKVRFFKQITTDVEGGAHAQRLFAILQKYDFSSKSQPERQINNNTFVVCDTAKVRFFKQITTQTHYVQKVRVLFAILQKYDFSSKSQHMSSSFGNLSVVCDTAKVRFFKQITTSLQLVECNSSCLRYCKSTIFQANHNRARYERTS